MSRPVRKQGTKGERAAARRGQARRRQHLNRAGLVLGGVVLVAVFVLTFSSVDEASGTTETAAWDLPALDGEGRVALVDFGGTPTVAAFFASWCHICRRELPGFAALAEELGEEVDFIGINTMNNGSGLGFAQQVGIGGWPLARDIGLGDGRQLATNFGARGSPATVIYNADGEVADVTLGGMTAGTLASKLNRLFGFGE